MSKRLNEVISNNEKNYILPFFWMYGDSEKKLREEVKRIKECGIGAFCVESHPHPDFLGEQWWSDLDILIDEAKKHSMKIWILDDLHFPTGQAAGKAEFAEEENRKMTLTNRHIDVTGPLAGSVFMPPESVKTEQIMFVCAARMDHPGEFLNLTECFFGNKLYFDVPDGVWRIYYFFKDDSSINPKHINFLRKGGAKLQLDTVYEPHYLRYKDEFGKTIAGFFSDEPGFYSAEVRSIFSYEYRLGHLHTMLPWDIDMEKWLTEKIKKPIEEILICLTDDYAYGVIEKKGETAAIRYSYMDIITEKYKECFTDEIGNWCRAHGVEYIGHIMEDNNIHAHTGLSAGHFFRATHGQDYSGTDTVMVQLIPGIEEMMHSAVSGYPENRMSDGEFYSAALYQMAVSQAQTEPLKKGRAMCEVFGAYGWGEGTKLMKWISDFMLVRGINRFVPHAFSPKEFPDPAYPPHFYANGNNPQFEGFKHLMPYVNRVAHLIDGGHHSASIAIIYHGEHDWCGGEAMYSQKPGLKLLNGHLQYDIIPYDALKNTEVTSDGVRVNTQCYKTIIVPYTDYISYSDNKSLKELCDKGINVVFIDAFPKYILCESESSMLPNKRTEFVSETSYDIIPLEKILDFCRESNEEKISVKDIKNSKVLRIYEYEHDDDYIYIIANQHPAKTVEAEIELKAEGNVVEYDAYENNVYRAEKRFVLKLEPYETQIYVVSKESFEQRAKEKYYFKNEMPLKTQEWKISLCKQGVYPQFTPYKKKDSLCYGEITKDMESFSGIACYEAEFDSTQLKDRQCMLKLYGVNETAQVWVNDMDLGVKISFPYIFDLSKAVIKERNKLRIEVRNTLYNEIHDRFSRYLPLEPLGLGDVTILM